jgi:hypothetical protein
LKKQARGNAHVRVTNIRNITKYGKIMIREINAKRINKPGYENMNKPYDKA